MDKRENATIVTAGVGRFDRVYWTQYREAECANTSACMPWHAGFGPAMAGPVENAKTRTLQHQQSADLRRRWLGDCGGFCQPIDCRVNAKQTREDALRVLEGAGVAGPSDTVFWVRALGNGLVLVFLRAYIYLASLAAQRRVRFTSHLSHAWEQTVHRECGGVRGRKGEEFEIRSGITSGGTARSVELQKPQYGYRR